MYSLLHVNAKKSFLTVEIEIALEIISKMWLLCLNNIYRK